MTAVNERKPMVRTQPAPIGPITSSIRLSDVYQPAADVVLMADLVGRFIHIYGIEQFQSDQYGEGVRLHFRETDANGGELSVDQLCVTFAFRVRRIAATLLHNEASCGFNPPIRCRVTEFATAKGTSYDLVDA
jgi:hypothetical protein